MTAAKRILMILENNGFPGDVRVLLEAQALADAGFQLTVICPRDENEKLAEQLGPVKVYRYPAPLQISGVLGYLVEYGYSLLMGLAYTWFVLLRHGFDAIHVHAPPDVNALIPSLFKLFRKPFVYDMHDLSPELFQARGGNPQRLLMQALYAFERLACRQADRLIATNETQRSVQTGRCRAEPSKCHIVRNGPNRRFMEEVVPHPGLAQPGKCLIGFVGVIAIQDGVDYLIRALHHLKNHLHRNDFCALVVGGGTALAEIRQLVHDLDLEQLVCFTDFIPFDDVPSYIAAFDICVTPDPSNAYNDTCTTIKTMEYMALRKPVVCFQTKENEVTAGEAALYAARNDVAELASQIARLIDDPGLRTRMGAVGRKRVEQGLAWSHQAPRLTALYRELFGSRGECEAASGAANQVEPT